MKRHQCWTAAIAAVVGLAAAGVQAQPNANLVSVSWSEDFEGVTLQSSVNELLGFPIVTAYADDVDSVPITGVYSPTAPGWTVDNSLSTYDGGATITAGVPGQGVADYGVDEWEGWSFVDKDFWSDAAGDQDRSDFGTTSGAFGTVAVADPDEYFDLSPLDGESGSPNNPTNGGYYSTSLTSPSFSVTGGSFFAAGFDFSWRDEAFDDNALADTFLDQNNQAVEILFTFDTGDVLQYAKWNSDSNDGFFLDDSADATFAGDGTEGFVQAPAGATSATVSFNMANAGNDWWMAVDNIEVNDLNASSTVYTEDFEGVVLGDSVNERRSTVPTGVTDVAGAPNTAPVENAFTHDAPAGWTSTTNDTDGVGPALPEDDDVGVFEWEGWSFADKQFWADVAGQGRGDFENAEGNVAVADGDEWDDLGNPDDGGNELQSLIETPAIAVPTLGDGQTFALLFDSSWRAEDDQRVVITADYGSGPVEILRWESDEASAFFHDDNTNERVLIELDPTGSEVTFGFYYAGRDDWWWAIDNVQVGVVPEPASALMGLLAVCGLGVSRRRR